MDEISNDFPMLSQFNNNKTSDLAKSQFIPENTKILDEKPEYGNN